MSSFENLKSKIISITSSPQSGSVNYGEHIQLFALCEDGTTWVKFISMGSANVPNDGKWHKV